MLYFYVGFIIYKYHTFERISIVEGRMNNLRIWCSKIFVQNQI